MRFGVWNVRSLYREGSLKAVASELAKYNLDLVADGFKVIGFFAHKGIISAVKRI